MQFMYGIFIKNSSEKQFFILTDGRKNILITFAKKKKKLLPIVKLCELVYSKEQKIVCR